MPKACLPIIAFCRGLGWVAALALAGCSGPNAANNPPPQWAADSATVRVAAGPQYARCAVWRFFWGTHYRDIWAAPVTVPVVHLATAIPDTLTPTRAGGSFQSHTLRLRTAAGREFVLRSVDKNASAALPTGWIRSLLGGLMKDQTSVGQPYGAYVAAPLAEAAGVFHTNPRLVFLANDPKLGKYRTSYANALYLLEERPEGDQRSVASFGHSPAIINTRRMLVDIHQRPGAQVEARAYLRARLLDMWLGDWSRREDQWRWASFPLGAGRVRYRPIPRDRDQAFFLFDDGLITRVVSWFVAKYTSFHTTLKPSSVGGLTTTARALDRTLLGTLTAEDFRQEADSLVRRLTDAAINQALTAGPPETRAGIAAKFAPMLRARRAALPAVARRYYELMAREAWLVGTDQAERFVFSEAGAGDLRVQMLVIRANKTDSLVAERIYDHHDTPQLQVFGLAGNDVFEFRAPLKVNIDVRIYGGTGHNQLLNSAGAGATVANVVWYSPPGSDAVPKSVGITTKPDPHPELTTDSHGWLKRYNLRD